MNKTVTAALAALTAAVVAYLAVPGTTTETEPPILPMLGQLKVAPDHAPVPYTRAAFGPAWKDVDRNGCDTRNDILARDLDDPVLRERSRCVVVAGVLNGPYTGRTIIFAKERASAVQIDHIVSLAEAWRTGAHSWTRPQREVFANDPANLLAVDGPTNAGKGDLGPEDWSPVTPDGACRYATTYAAVKVKYQLTTTSQELAALRDTIKETCS